MNPLEPGTTLELRPGTVSRHVLALFGAGSGDTNPIHVDLDMARAAGFDDVFAHGMLSVAYLGRLLTESFGHERLRSLDIRFTAITPVLAEPVCTAVVRELVDGEAHLDLAVVLADGTTTVAGTAVVAA